MRRPSIPTTVKGCEYLTDQPETKRFVHIFTPNKKELKRHYNYVYLLLIPILLLILFSLQPFLVLQILNLLLLILKQLL